MADNRAWPDGVPDDIIWVDVLGDRVLARRALCRKG